MKIILFSRPRTAHVPEELRQIFAAVEECGFDYAVNDEFAATLETLIGLHIPASRRYGRDVGRQPAGSVLVCYGGDGTLLEGVRRLGGREIPVVGINSGHLGFLTIAPRDGFRRIFEAIRAGELKTDPRTMIEVSGLGRRNRPALAVNEVSVERQGPGMISVDTYVDGLLVATVHGDGIIVSTPTGSTAYSLSAGGPVVAPRCACLIIAPVAPHNLTMRPVVVPDGSTITLTIHARQADVNVTLDNVTRRIREGSTLTVRRSSRRFFLAVPHNISFYDTLRNKMMWGVDIRS